MIYPTAEQIIGFNARHLGGQAAVRDAGLVQSAVARPQTVAFGVEAYPSPDERAAALLHSIVCNHPFVDGNKRHGLGGNGDHAGGRRPRFRAHR